MLKASALFFGKCSFPSRIRGSIYPKVCSLIPLFLYFFIPLFFSIILGLVIIIKEKNSLILPGEPLKNNSPYFLFNLQQLKCVEFFNNLWILSFNFLASFQPRLQYSRFATAAAEAYNIEPSTDGDR